MRSYHIPGESSDVMEKSGLLVLYMRFTIRSRAEMPNEEFAAEISRASLYFPGEVPKPRVMTVSSTTKLRNRRG